MGEHQHDGVRSVEHLFGTVDDMCPGRLESIRFARGPVPDHERYSRPQHIQSDGLAHGAYADESCLHTLLQKWLMRHTRVQTNAGLAWVRKCGREFRRS